MFESSCASFVDTLAKGQQGDDSALGEILDQNVRNLYSEAKRLISKRLQQLRDPADLLQSTSIILWVWLRQGKWDIQSPQQLTALARTMLRRQAARICRALKAEFSTNTIEIKLTETLTDFPIATLAGP